MVWEVKEPGLSSQRTRGHVLAAGHEGRTCPSSSGLALGPGQVVPPFGQASVMGGLVNLLFRKSIVASMRGLGIEGQSQVSPHPGEVGHPSCKLVNLPLDTSVVAEELGAELETMALLKDQGALTEVEFDSWCLEHFSALPGLHLSLRKSKWNAWQLVTSESTAWAVCRFGGTSFPYFSAQLWRSIVVRGESYRWQRVGARSVKTHDLVSESSGEPVLRMSGLHFDRKAQTVVDLVGQGSYRFPMSGSMMLATDASGNRLAHYRRPWIKANGRNTARRTPLCDVVVSDRGKSIPGFEFVVAATTPLIVRFGDEPMAKYI